LTLHRHNTHPMTLTPKIFFVCKDFQGVYAATAVRGVMIDLGTLGALRSLAYGVNDLGQVVGGADPFSTPQPSCGGCVPEHAFLWKSGAMSDLGTLGGNYSFALVSNNQGQLVGASTLAGDLHEHAVLWEGGVMTDLGTLSGDTDSEATDISPTGQVVGLSCGETTCAAFLWQNGAMTDLNTLIRGISDL
jgi:probable HAF family extracellular repeat protein